MFFIMVLLVSSFANSHAGDKHKTLADETPFTLMFPDGSNEVLATTIGETRWSKTIQNAVNELGTDNPIPIHNVSSDYFRVFTDALLVSCSGPGPMRYCNLNEASQKSDKKEVYKHLEQTIQMVGRRTSLEQANYLDVDPPFRKLLAKLYTTRITYPSTQRFGQFIFPTMTFGHNKDVIFDNFTHELEPVIADVLGAATLEAIEMQTLTLSTSQQLADQERTELGTISNADADGNFIYITCQAKPFQKPIYYKLFHVNAATKNITAHTIEIPGFFDTSDSKCALSHDGTYLLTTWFPFTDNTYCGITLYNISAVNQGVIRPLHTNKTTTINGHMIDTLLFDENTNKFNLIASRDTKGHVALKTFDFCTLDPSNPSSLNQISINQNKESDWEIMNWSCVNGALIGLYVDHKHGLMYKNGQLFKCFLESSTNKWHYSDGDKKQDAPFETIEAYADYSPNRLCGALPLSYISNIDAKIPFGNHLPEKPLGLGLPVEFTMPFNTPDPSYNYTESETDEHFDSSNFCINRVTHSQKEKQTSTYEITIQQLVPSEFVKAWKLLGNKLREGNNNILPDAYFLYLYYTRNLQHCTDNACQLLFEHISPEIKAIYAITNSAQLKTAYAAPSNPMLSDDEEDSDSSTEQMY